MEGQSSRERLRQDPLGFVFFNPRGLRPGWRVLIFLALLWILSNAVAFLLWRIPGVPRGLVPSALILNESLGFATVVFCSWVMSRIESRQMGDYGLPLRNSGLLPRFIRGCLFWGFLPLTLLLLVLRALHAFYFGNLALHHGAILSWGAVWGLFFILVGLSEEYSLRGYVLYTLTEGIGFWPAAIILAAVFAGLHMFNAGETRIGILTTGFFGIFAALTLRYTGNLWLAVGAHAGWDWGESYFYGVNDSGFRVPGHLLNSYIAGPDWLSGGATGPEASLLCLALFAVMAVLFALLYRRAREPVLVVTRQ